MEITETHTFDHDWGGKDPIKMWSKTCYILIASSILAFINIGFIAGLITGVVDLIMIYQLKYFLDKNNIRARFNTVESRGKHILFLGIYTLLLGYIISSIVVERPENEIMSLLIKVVGVASILHIIARILINADIMILKYDYDGRYMKHFKDKDTPIKYIFDQYDGVGPIYGVIANNCGVEIFSEYKYKNKLYDKHTVFEYLKKYDKHIEDLTDDDYAIIANIYIYENEVYDLNDVKEYAKKINQDYLWNLREDDFKLIKKM